MRSFNQADPTRLLTAEMEKYGFADYNSIGDLVGHQLGAMSSTGSSARALSPGCDGRASRLTIQPGRGR